MAGPIDARVSPTKVNELAQEKPIEWFRANMIGTVPAQVRRPRPARLSRLPPALRVHEHELGQAPQGAFVDFCRHRVDGRHGQG